MNKYTETSETKGREKRITKLIEELDTTKSNTKRKRKVRKLRVERNDYRGGRRRR